MRFKTLPVLLSILACLFASAIAQAQEESLSDRSLTVAIKEAPPFAMKTETGEWTGLTVELWEEIALDLGLGFTYEERSLEGLAEGLDTGEVDVALGAFSITAERETRFDFTHGYYRSGLGIVVGPAPKKGFFSYFGMLFSWQFLSALFTLLLLLAGVGIVIWLAERSANPEEFGGSPHDGIGKGVWWSAVTMTTVGYGDKAPRSLLGRIVGLAWMFISIIIIAGITGALATAFTVNSLDQGIEGPDDLRGLRVAAVSGASSVAWLDARNYRVRQYDTLEEALQAVADGDAAAAVHDAPLARYVIDNALDADLRVLAPTFERQSYGIAFPDASPLREPVDRALLAYMATPEWRDQVVRFTGDIEP